ncbi:hypothetical protein N0Q91_18465 [Sinorhizobium sp. K101]|uniref:hypothetical protein n=1 Tax=unclassified Sinorhizobium TaxID=2613772 RepID=UPI0023D88EF6|nr:MULTISPECIES: hypothetical protein [unclassified Sinorhizobium]WEJ10028.1 hypothetical protein N0Q90_18710 [Sinorhizobium sp. M103]WEJ15416.1 hypothetical protein N0Q91_18465 [Sinorhizobium sp. K101]
MAIGFIKKIFSFGKDVVEEKPAPPQETAAADEVAVTPLSLRENRAVPRHRSRKIVVQPRQRKLARTIAMFPSRQTRQRPKPRVRKSQ